MTTFSDAIAEVENTVGEVDATLTTDVGVFVNRAQRKVARSHPWPELRKVAWINTVAPYSTGTVAVTNNSTTVTLTGGTWPTDVASAKYRFALGYGGTWYEVATRSSDTVILLAQAYVGDTDTSTTFVVYKVHYSLATDLETIEILRVHEHPRGGVFPLKLVTPGMLGWWGNDLPLAAYAPLSYIHVEPLSATVRQIRLGPAAPDRVYRVECIYRMIPTLMVVTSQEVFTLGEDAIPCVIEYAKALAFERDHPAKSKAAMREYRALIADIWDETNESDDTGFQAGQGRVLGMDDGEFRVAPPDWSSLEL